MPVPSKVLFAALTSVAAAAATASAQVVITEVHYNPNGSETASQEWIEIYNPTSSAIDLSGWSWGDSQDIQYTGPFASGTSLAPGQAAILLFQNPTEFAAMWGPSIKVIPTDTAISLSNMASATNELIVLRDANRNIIDEVNYESGTNGWAPSTNGRSIYLLPNAMGLTPNDLGANWALSTNGTDGAYLARIINPAITSAFDPDTASPGFVSLATNPSPARGDFNFDGGVDASDIDSFILAANESAPFSAYISALQPAFALLYPGQTLTADIINQIGDFNNDGGVDASDIDPFIVFANNAGSPTAPIPEPAALCMLAPLGALALRRRR